MGQQDWTSFDPEGLFGWNDALTVGKAILENNIKSTDNFFTGVWSGIIDNNTPSFIHLAEGGYDPAYAGSYNAGKEFGHALGLVQGAYEIGSGGGTFLGAVGVGAADIPVTASGVGTVPGAAIEGGAVVVATGGAIQALHGAAVEANSAGLLYNDLFSKNTKATTGSQPKPEVAADTLNGGKRIDNKQLIAKPSEPGRPPIGADGHPVELHHEIQDLGNASPLNEMTRTKHRGKGNYKINHTNTGQSPSAVDRSEFDRIRTKHWKSEHEKGRFDNLPPQEEEK